VFFFWCFDISPAGRVWHDVAGEGVPCPDDRWQLEAAVAATLALEVLTDQAGFCIGEIDGIPALAGSSAGVTLCLNRTMPALMLGSSVSGNSPKS
jgi:hypothetical protein